MSNATTTPMRRGPYALAEALAEAAGLDAAAFRRAHRVREWHVVIDGRVVPDAKVRHLRGGGWGFDVVCTCGWESHTGGGVYSYVRNRHIEHAVDIASEALVERGKTAIAALQTALLPVGAADDAQ
jgi:hypothetical protein